jgi:nitroimidazol reductase NimA-like FMN-containing flavoprotein (pyridoxamine 5'-phosphate oxidase superfamily)
MTSRPLFSALSPTQCEQMLARHHIARLAYSHQDRVDVEPIHYVFHDQWIYMRTQPGTKLSRIVHNPWVALEIDESRALFDWDSVVVRGRLQLLDNGPHDAARARYRTAVEALRTLIPEALTKDDPTPDRTIICGVFVDALEGRRARTGGAEAAPSSQPT